MSFWHIIAVRCMWPHKILLISQISILLVSQIASLRAYPIIKNEGALGIGTILSEGSTSSFGIIFAIMLLYAADLSVCNSFNDALDQLDSDYCHISTETDHVRCLCSKKCNADNMFTVRNKYTKISLAIGQSLYSQIWHRPSKATYYWGVGWNGPFFF